MKQIIKKPIISEKSFSQSASNKFTFLVDPNADKETVKELVEELYKVSVLKVNSQNVIGKIKRVKGKNGKRNDFKKIVVTLKPGQKIDLFEIETEDKKEDKKDKKADKKAEAKSDKKEEKVEKADKSGVTTTIKKTK